MEQGAWTPPGPFSARVREDTATRFPCLGLSTFPRACEVPPHAVPPAWNASLSNCFHPLGKTATPSYALRVHT